MARLFGLIVTLSILVPILASAHQAVAHQREIASFMLRSEAPAPSVLSCRRYQDCDDE